MRYKTAFGVPMSRFLWVLAAVGCSDYDLRGPSFPPVVNTPRVPETPLRTDVLTQTTSPMVDVLWVVDNSSSMSEEANKLSQNFPIFLNFFLGSGLDWHVGVVSTNMEVADQKGKLLSAGGYNWIDPDTEEPEAVFSAMVPYFDEVGVSHTESGLAASYTAIEVLGDDNNAGFIREDASLHIVVISDENDYSTTPTVEEYIQWLDLYKPDPSLRTFSAITGLQVCSGAAEVGQRYINVSDTIGGVLWSICDNDWEPVLEAIGEQASALSTEWYLSELPVLGTISVTVEEDGLAPLILLEGEDWTYNPVRNSVHMVDYVPNPLARVVITYELLSAQAAE